MTEHGKLVEVLLSETPRDPQLLADYNEAITALLTTIHLCIVAGNDGAAKATAETLFMLGYHAGRKPQPENNEGEQS